MRKISTELLNQIREEIGCVGLLVLATDSMIPCPDHLAGEECEHGHEVALAINNLSPFAIMTILSQEFENNHGS